LNNSFKKICCKNLGIFSLKEDLLQLLSVSKFIQNELMKDITDICHQKFCSKEFFTLSLTGSKESSIFELSTGLSIIFF
jgi:hypothetical protein